MPNPAPHRNPTVLPSALLALGAAIGLAPAAMAQPYAEQLVTGAARYYASEAEKKAGAPSVVLAAPFNAEPGVPDWFRVRPSFDRIDGGTRAHIAGEPGTRYYGTGLVGGSISHEGTRFSTSAGGRFPWVLAVRPDGSSFGVIADTTFPCEVDLTDGVTFTSADPAMPVLAFEGASPMEVLFTLYAHTWRIALPSREHLGFHIGGAVSVEESGYATLADAARDLPGLVLWDDAARRQRAAASSGDVTLDAWVQPPAGGPDELDRWVARADGTPLTLRSAPGHRLPDPTRNSAIQAWGREAAQSLPKRVGEGSIVLLRSVFDSPVRTGAGAIPGPLDEARFRPDEPIGPAGGVDRYGTVLDFLFARGLRSQLEAATPEYRPLILSRRSWLGSHRAGAPLVDTLPPTPAGLEQVIPTTLNLGLSGHALSAIAVGGTTGEMDPALYARWFGLAATLPLPCAISGPGARREPWAFGPEVAATCRQALARRSRLLPHYYTSLFGCFMWGEALIRPLMFDDPTNEALRSEQSMFLVGRDLLVVPRPDPGATGEERALPPGGWRRLDFPEIGRPDLPDLYIRWGSIVPTRDPAAPMHPDIPLGEEGVVLVVNLDEKGEAIGRLFDDAGDGDALYRNQCRYGTYRATTAGRRVTIMLSQLDGGLGMPDRPLAIRLLTDEGEFTGAARDGQVIWIDLPPKP